MAALIEFVASDDASFATGSELVAERRRHDRLNSACLAMRMMRDASSRGWHRWLCWVMPAPIRGPKP